MSITFNGRVCSEVDVREIEKNGMSTIIGSFRMAVNKNYADKQRTVFTTITVFGKYAYTMRDNLKKGWFITFDGDFDYFRPIDTWVYNGTTYNSVRFVANKIDFSMNKRNSTDTSVTRPITPPIRVPNLVTETKSTTTYEMEVEMPEYGNSAEYENVDDGYDTLLPF